MRMKPAIASVILATGIFCAAAGMARADGDVSRGREVSIKHCARCHVVGDYNRMGGIDSTPSFQLLARRADFEDLVRTFYQRRPHPVFVRVPGVPRWTNLPPYAAPFEVTPEQIEDIVAFVRTLKSMKRRPRRRRR
jgi:mono/diheme cytochrome c family protein